jgi:O-antigen ligase
MASHRLISWLKRGWWWLLHAGFLLLCLRFLIAATHETYPDVLPVLVLTAGGLGLSAWRPQAALFAFTAFVPLLNGLGYVGLTGLPALASLVFSGVFVGWILRQIASWAKGEKRKAKSEKHEAEGGTTDSRNCRTTEAGEPSGRSDRWTVVTVKRYPTVKLATDVLISVVLLSLAVQIARHHDAAGFWPAFRGQPVFGYGDPLYFITSAFVWLQGLFLFRLLGVQGREVVAWAKPVFAIYGITLAAFYLFQLCLHVPEPSDTTTYCSPFEEFHSLGSIAVAVFAFAIASWQKRPWMRTALYGISVIALLALVVASWSRAAWLSGALVLLLVAWIRLPRRWSMAALALGIMAIAIINLNAHRESWQRNEYLMRLISLARVENLSNKSPHRLDLYYKTLGMIREHPFVGHGIGSIYLTSVRFARPGDPYDAIPNFAHNFLLQMAAELGVPVATLFLALILFTLWQGYRRSGARRKFQVPSPFAEASADKSSKLQDLELLGVTMALTAYLITQMTANALNIYVSNQFFFWFLMAAVLCASPKSEVQSLKSKVEV